MRVMKFGGTSVGTSAAIDQTANILADAYRNGDRVVAVVSAMGGVTNVLLETAMAAAEGHLTDTEPMRTDLLTRHMTVTAELIPDAEQRWAIDMELVNLTQRVADLVASVQVLGDLSPRVNDWVASFGERMISQVLAGVLEARGVPSQAVDAAEVIITDGVFGGATPDLDKTRAAAARVIVPLLEAGKVPVVTGFYGGDERGATTTLGRGGSDYAASVLAHALDAEAVWIWTDVDGVLSADPRLVPEAHTLPAISFAEATEMAYFGAKVIHPRTMQPAAERGIPIWIKNTFRPEAPGTCIGPEPTVNGAVKAITAIPGLSAITIEGSGLLDVAGVTARIFTAVGKAGANVYMISQASSQQSLSFVVAGKDAPAALRALEDEFAFDLQRRRLLRVWEDPDLAIIAVVGAGMRGTPGVAGRVFQTLGDEGINIVAIAQGSSELNISCTVLASELARAVPALHRAFGLGSQR